MSHFVLFVPFVHESQSELSHLFLSKAISTSISSSFSIKLLHRFSDLYLFHQSYSSQVSIYFNFNFRYILQMYQGVFTQCRGVAHNSTFSDFPQSVYLFLFTSSVLCAYGASFPSQFLAQYGAITIPYICCFVQGTYHPIHFQWGIHSSHSWLLFVAPYISHH